jgi:nitrous oxidase accessory protein NosD
MRKASAVLLSALILACLMMLSSNLGSARAGTITVPDDYLTIQEAINQASEGDIIFVRNGTYCENVVVNKSVALVGEDKECTVIDGGEVGTVIEIDSDNVTVSGFEIRNCSITGEDWGIALNQSSKSIVSGNIIRSVCAIRVIGGSGNRIIDNSVMGTDDYCVWNGLQLVNCSGNVVSHNILSSHCHFALTMHNSTDNHISFNYISGHFVPFPFTMEKSSNNSIVGNTMWQPVPLFGGHICFTESNGNVLYHNSFLADEGPNTMLIDEFSVNVWDNGCEGNYWSSYNGTDLNSDGVGDTYVPWEGVDDYPLMNPYWNAGDIDHDLDVDIYDVVKAAAAYGSVSLDSRWNPHCDIAEPYGIIDIFDIVTIAVSYGEEYTP